MRFPFPVSEATESDAAPGPAAEPSLREIEVEEVVEDVQLSALPDRVAGEPVAEPAGYRERRIRALWRFPRLSPNRKQLHAQLRCPAQDRSPR